MKRILWFILAAGISLSAQAQRTCRILSREDGRITFAVDKVDAPKGDVGPFWSGIETAGELNVSESSRNPEILANSFADVEQLYDVGEDVLFKMLLKAWCGHHPVVLTPDAIWLVICQQFSYAVNQDPEAFRDLLVSHEGKKELKVITNNLLSEQADWEGLIDSFTAEIAGNTKNGIAGALVADFSTSGRDERIASEVTLMDVTKEYFEFLAIYIACGIPSVTLTGTPDDWRKVLEKTRALEAYGLGWWTAELEPILEEFIKASEGRPNARFWKNMVKHSRPRIIRGPTCMGRDKMTRFDGWFLKFFPFDSNGRTPEKVTVMQTMLPETVVVPFKYRILTPEGVLLEEIPMELVAGIVGLLQEPETFGLTPKIGWFVRTAYPAEP